MTLLFCLYYGWVINVLLQKTLEDRFRLACTYEIVAASDYQLTIPYPESSSVNFKGKKVKTLHTSTWMWVKVYSVNDRVILLVKVRANDYYKRCD